MVARRADVGGKAGLNRKKKKKAKKGKKGSADKKASVTMSSASSIKAAWWDAPAATDAIGFSARAAGSRRYRLHRRRNS